MILIKTSRIDVKQNKNKIKHTEKSGQCLDHFDNPVTRILEISCMNGEGSVSA